MIAVDRSRWSDPCACSGDRPFRRRRPRDSVEIDAAPRRWSEARSDQGTGGPSAPLWMICLKALAAQRSARVQGAECNGCGKADIGDRKRSGSILTRADGVVRAQESPVTSAARSLDSGHSRRAAWKNRQGIDHAIRKLARRTARTVTGRHAWMGTGYLGPGGRVASAIYNSP
jgi:hypothetical protein